MIERAFNGNIYSLSDELFHCSILIIWKQASTQHHVRLAVKASVYAASRTTGTSTLARSRRLNDKHPWNSCKHRGFIHDDCPCIMTPSWELDYDAVNNNSKALVNTIYRFFISITSRFIWKINILWLRLIGEGL